VAVDQGRRAQLALWLLCDAVRRLLPLADEDDWNDEPFEQNFAP
jgi:hypothetical protein